MRTARWVCPGLRLLPANATAGATNAPVSRGGYLLLKQQPVLRNPYFAVSNDKGSCTITNVPPGVHQLKAWHERLPAQSREITVPEHGEARADFTPGISGLPKY